jgi:hypothetical protein
VFSVTLSAAHQQCLVGPTTAGVRRLHPIDGLLGAEAVVELRLGGEECLQGLARCRVVGRLGDGAERDAHRGEAGAVRRVVGRNSVQSAVFALSPRSSNTCRSSSTQEPWPLGGIPGRTR